MSFKKNLFFCSYVFPKTMFFCSYVFPKTMFFCLTAACVVRFGDRTS